MTEVKSNIFSYLFKNKLFLFVLFIKITSSFLFGSDFPLDYFIPFVKQFVMNPLENPYSYFVAQDFADAFPYPPLMLVILSVPFALMNLFGFLADKVTMFDLFLLRIPLLFADIGILVLLSKLLIGKQKELIIYYWASPILFYITYVHGQLDVIPMFFLFASFGLIFIKNAFARILAFVVFGAGLAVKTHLLLAYPFLMMYVWKQKRKFSEIIIFSLISAGIFSFFNLPFIDDGFVKMVFMSEQQKRFFDFNVPIYDNLFIFIAPLMYFLLFFKFAGYKKLNQDALMMILSLVFSIFVVLVPPRIGWFFWGIPFIIYFFIKLETVRRFTFWALNIAFFLFFWTSKDGDIPQIFQILSSEALSAPNLYLIIQNAGFNAAVLSSLLFSALASSVLVIAYWIYKFGISTNEEYFIRNKPFTIGIGGDSGTGKTTLSELLFKTFGNKNTLVVNGDDVHKWERGDKNWQFQTHLNPNSNRLNIDYFQAIQLMKGKPIQRRFYDHHTGKFTEPVVIDPKKFILFVGLHPFYIKGMREMQDIKIFLQPQEELRKHWKILRDMKERGYAKEKILRALKQRKPDSNKYILPQKDFADIVFSFNINEKLKIGVEILEMNKISLLVRFDNSIDFEKIEKVLSSIPTLSVKQTYDEDCEHQTLEFHGMMNKEEIKRATRLIVPNYGSIIEYEPLWQNNYDGIIQLLTLFYLDEISKKTGPKYE